MKGLNNSCKQPFTNSRIMFCLYLVTIYFCKKLLLSPLVSKNKLKKSLNCASMFNSILVFHNNVTI